MTTNAFSTASTIGNNSDNHYDLVAESEGFEPPVRRNAYTAFRVRLFRPLRQLSSNNLCLTLFATAKVLFFFDIPKFLAQKLFLNTHFLTNDSVRLQCPAF